MQAGGQSSCQAHHTSAITIRDQLTSGPQPVSGETLLVPAAPRSSLFFGRNLQGFGFQSTGEVQPQRPGEDAAIGSMKDNPPSESALSSSSTARTVPLAALAVAVLSEPKYFHCIFWEELERSTQSSKM